MDQLERDELYISHILIAAEHVGQFIIDVTYEKYLKDLMLQNALVKELEVIGEAARRLSADFIIKNDKIDWKQIIGMRHKLVHDYFEINLKEVWDTANNDVPKLKKALGKINTGGNL
ncbi:MAG: DUF86 domain-containing protein [Patescibacteria group bacterium]